VAYFKIQSHHLPGRSEGNHENLLVLPSILKSVWFCFREVLASEGLLDMADRADWRDCKATREQETEMANKFRSAFEPFDFTL
jgi:hypothetical protein